MSHEFGYELSERLSARIARSFLLHHLTPGAGIAIAVYLVATFLLFLIAPPRIAGMFAGFVRARLVASGVRIVAR